MTSQKFLIADAINSKAGAHSKNEHLSSVRFWLAYAAEHPAPDGETYRILTHKDQTFLACWSDVDQAWFPARRFGAPNYVKLYGSHLP